MSRISVRHLLKRGWMPPVAAVALAAVAGFSTADTSWLDEAQ